MFIDTCLLFLNFLKENQSTPLSVPNPTNNILNIKTEGEYLLQFEITNITGQKVMTSPIHGQKQNIDITHLSSGAYLIKVESNKGIKVRSEEHTSELQSRPHLVCRLLLEKKK